MEPLNKGVLNSTKPVYTLGQFIRGDLLTGQSPKVEGIYGYDY